MKQLYIRAGNSKETQDILIIGEESELGGRDDAYKPNKGSTFYPLKIDEFTKRKGLTYIHVTPNIILDKSSYNRDYDVHKFIKDCCSDLVVWDGETNTGRVRSREAFIIKGDINKTIKELYYRIEDEIHGSHSYIHRQRVKNIFKNIFLFPFRIILSVIIIIFFKKKRLLKKIWR